MKAINLILSAAKAKKYAEAYEDSPLVNEIEGIGLHPEINEHLESGNIHSPAVLSAVTKTARRLIKAGHSTGFESDRPKKGSSRAVFFPSEPHKIILDGKPTGAHSVVKIAFPGVLDKYTGDETLLGQHQNSIENDYFAQKHWGVLRRKDDHSGHFETNHETGILPPVFDSHPNDHWLHMGRIRKAKAADWKKLTKTPDFPKGITHEQMYDTLMHHYAQAHGQKWHAAEKHDIDKLSEHPFIHTVNDFVATMGQHPGDYHVDNMGVYEHPHGSKHLVISDYGFSTEVAKMYHNARKNQQRAYENRMFNLWRHV